MLLEDDRDIRESTKLLLETEGYVIIAPKNIPSVEEIAAAGPSLILLDIWLGQTDGSELGKAIKQHKGLENVPLLVISAARDIVEITAAVSADGFIVKPYEMETLISAVRSHLKN
ncbi:hypothetical protein A2Z33_00580 [Candidatus Gottesmanbacteria bacterium RBG_16_52_11]|uniref:Response regulatory domain-containing protein n=1 Tax=Candidatus Gottesmanbacteria bacterium RBG_16_52_11 TaxID=1798374 RepID=A0A1F5YNI7_9BACT|nr:MAG: hypothetical protein A2Z33_00580 [Candidatus Gottesmanbacteria bacterium RBG_16_52_11]